jgi:hypothetical protein
MEGARRVAVAGYRQLLEDGPDTCNSESDAEYSDHGEELTDMYGSVITSRRTLSTTWRSSPRPFRRCLS